METKIRKRNDELLKGIFEENFHEMLKFLYPNAAEIFDFDEGFSFLDKELFQIIPDRKKQKSKRIADLLVKTKLKNKKEKWIIVHMLFLPVKNHC